jgi:hypothetical protein
MQAGSPSSWPSFGNNREVQDLVPSRVTIHRPRIGASRVQVQEDSLANSRLSSVVAIFPVIGHAGIAEDEPD